ncbi:MAG: MAPEG family protein [Rhodospirillaceae bacterium]|nr:MAPEG family protein [Rhodospirillaceae bacterium]
MPAITVTPLYAGLLALLFLVLSQRAIGARRKARVALGPGNDPALLRALRVHGNFAEYVPLALVLLMLLELQLVPALLLHGLGLALLLARVIHAIGVAREPEQFRYRIAGMVLTLTTIGVMALGNLVLALGW